MVRVRSQARSDLSVERGLVGDVHLDVDRVGGIEVRLVELGHVGVLETDLPGEARTPGQLDRG